MKSKTNLDIFMNEILYTLKYRKTTMKDVMMDIYLRETDNETRCVEHMLKWYADVPRETLELGAYPYHLINGYYSVLSEEAIIGVDSKPIEWYTMFKTLIRLNIIPSRYSQMQLKDFMKIVRLKKEDKK